jgi:hypothetical protein
MGGEVGERVEGPHGCGGIVVERGKAGEGVVVGNGVVGRRFFAGVSLAFTRSWLEIAVLAPKDRVQRKGQCCQCPVWKKLRSNRTLD